MVSTLSLSLSVAGSRAGDGASVLASVLSGLGGVISGRPSVLAGGPRTERFTGEVLSTLCFDFLGKRWSKHPFSFSFLVRRLHPQMHMPATNGCGMVPASAENGARWHAAGKGLSQMHYA